LVHKFSEIISCDAATIEHGWEVIVVDRSDETNVWVGRANRDGTVHAVTAGHKIPKFPWPDKGVTAGKGVSTTQINKKDAVVGLFRGQFLQPSHKASGSILIAGFGQGVHFVNLIEKRVRVGFRYGGRRKGRCNKSKGEKWDEDERIKLNSQTELLDKHIRRYFQISKGKLDKPTRGCG
jgi:hypothetical protein